MKNLMSEAGLKEPLFKYDEFFEVTFLRASYYDKELVLRKMEVEKY